MYRKQLFHTTRFILCLLVSVNSVRAAVMGLKKSELARVTALYLEGRARILPFDTAANEEVGMLRYTMMEW